jgi:hypothetical protein
LLTDFLLFTAVARYSYYFTNSAVAKQRNNGNNRLCNIKGLTATGTKAEKTGKHYKKDLTYNILKTNV